MKASDEKGAILGIVLIYMLLMTVLGYGILHLSYANSIQTNKSVFSNQAFWLADAGIEQVLCKLTTDSPAGYRQNPTGFSGSGEILNNYNGNYTVSVNNSDPDLTVFTSRGTYGQLNNRSVSYTLPKAFFSPLYYDKNAHCDAGITFQGGAPTSGTVPASMDLSYYSNAAQAAGQYNSGNKTFSAGVYSGIWYIAGRATIGNGVTINGSVVTTNGIDFNGNNIVISPTLPYPALVTNGNLNISNNSDITVKGVVYVGGNILAQNNSYSSFTGTIITGGNVNYQQAQAVVVTYDPAVITNPPPGLDFPGMPGAGGSYWREVPS